MTRPPPPAEPAADPSQRRLSQRWRRQPSPHSRRPATAESGNVESPTARPPHALAAPRRLDTSPVESWCNLLCGVPM